MILLIAGAPGWLSDALLESLEREPMPGVSRVRCMFHPASLGGADEYRRRFARLELEVVPGDLGDIASLEVAVAGAGAVVHGAAIMHPRWTRDYFQINTLGTRRFAEAAVHAGVKRFVFVSTNAAGGRSSSAALMHESDPAKPKSKYGLSKLLAEAWLMAVPGDMERVVLRPCMFYGPPVPQRHVEVYRRIQSSFMPLVGGGRYARSLVYIDNLVQAVRLALTRDEAVGQTYYIADADHYTTRDVVDAMAAAVGVTPRYLRLPATMAKLAYELDRAASIHDLYFQELHLLGEADWNVGVSIDKARRELGYAPTTGLREGMRNAVAWCRAKGLLA